MGQGGPVGGSGSELATSDGIRSITRMLPSSANRIPVDFPASSRVAALRPKLLNPAPGHTLIRHLERSTKRVVPVPKALPCISDAAMSSGVKHAVSQKVPHQSSGFLPLQKIQLAGHWIETVRGPLPLAASLPGSLCMRILQRWQLSLHTLERELPARPLRS